MTVRVRIAPSPTGNLHIGTARTALFNWLYARRHGGKFILRIEDTDRERSRDEYTQNILSGLAWLGIDFDEGPFYQTQRLEHYKEAVRALLDRGLAYFCYASAEELEQMRAEQKAKKQAPRYDNRHRNLTSEQQAAYVAEGRRPVVRFKIEEPREVTWHDMVRGEVTWNTRDLGGDMVIARTDDQGQVSLPLYNFAVVIDDIEMDITHVIRGEDHIANTAKQILLYEAMGASMPEFAHLPLILNKDGAKISKRDGATSVDEFRAMGYIPEAFNNYMVLLGWSKPDAQDIFTMQDAAPLFGFDRVNKAGARFDWDKLNWLNSQYLHDMPVEDLCDRLIPFWQQAGFNREVDFAAERGWLLELVTLIAPSLTRLTDAVEMTRFLFESELKFTDAAIAALQPEAVKPVITALLGQLKDTPVLTADAANSLIQTVTKLQNVKKGMVMKPLRCALTGDVRGPELIPSFLLLHQRGLAIPRLQQALSIT
ncbi:glutamate--tRNA ligase [Pseudanabaena sp. PCC 6802]|uniref:glutamate--tRNA ligase n=1 Tax=Pseudanabaena sp. PCC 6802 TaxID=118173 RepID=UPI00034BA0D4|nr:glutamate--tRNA ligase [Pseudanabaena sp. PCC 6802]